ncbi:MAG TPA: hypothetical protein VLY04_08370 [Bryobacteraceae bacterium]|nr:hypothetical protein [Bryobacteraceae bacterium]
MGLRTLAVFLILTPLLQALDPPPGQTAPAEPEPRYDTATSVDAMAVVTDVKEVAKNNPLCGSHLIVRLESARSATDTLEVYLGPADFLKDFEFTLAKGDRIEIKGSRVRFGGNPIVLAREVRKNSTTLYLRDDRGAPYWKAAGKS